MADPLSTFLTNAAASAVGALVAGGLGLRFAILKFRREKAFEQVLNWHVAAARAFFDASWKVSAAAKLTREAKLPAAVLERYWVEADEAIGIANSALVGIDFYASRRTVEEVERLETARVAVLSTSPPRQDGVVQWRIPEFTNVQAQAARCMRDVSFALTADIRSMLGIQPLSKRSWELRFSNPADLPARE